MRLRQFILLCCMMHWHSCSKVTDTFVFDCTVVSASDGQPVADAIAVISGRSVSGGSFNPNFQTLGTATTDAQGRFRIEVDKAVYSAFRIALSHPTHFTRAVTINPDDVPISEPYANTFSLEQHAWVFVHVLNQNASLAIDVTIDAPSDGCTACCEQLLISKQGEVFDTTVACSAYGARTVMLSGSFINNAGNTVIINRQDQTIPQDTVHIELTY